MAPIDYNKLKGNPVYIFTGSLREFQELKVQYPKLDLHFITDGQMLFQRTPGHIIRHGSWWNHFHSADIEESISWMESKFNEQIQHGDRDAKPFQYGDNIAEDED